MQVQFALLELPVSGPNGPHKLALGGPKHALMLTATDNQLKPNTVQYSHACTAMHAQVQARV